MVRAFSSRPLPDGKIDALCEQARHAPSAGNTQAVSFLILDTPDVTSRYWNTTLPPERRSSFSFPKLLDAPTIVLVLLKPHAYLDRYSEKDKKHTMRGLNFDAWPVPFWWVDSGAVIQNLLLLATAEGLGACVVGLFDHEDEIRTEFGLPDDQRIVTALTIGHAIEDSPGRSAHRQWKPVSEIIKRPT